MKLVGHPHALSAVHSSMSTQVRLEGDKVSPAGQVQRSGEPRTQVYSQPPLRTLQSTVVGSSPVSMGVQVRALACSWYPGRQLHTYELTVSVQLWSQPPFSYKHSFSELQLTPSPTLTLTKPTVQTQNATDRFVCVTATSHIPSQRRLPHSLSTSPVPANRLSTDPTCPVLPVAPVSPTDPFVPTTPRGPVTPVTPVYPMSPAAPVTPGGPASPVSPVAPYLPGRPVAPSTPVRPGSPPVPLNPVTPTLPFIPRDPGAPGSPRIPVAPGGPSAPLSPPVPTTPWTPVAPDLPWTPRTPVPPVCPTCPVAPVHPVTPVSPV